MGLFQSHQRLSGQLHYNEERFKSVNRWCLSHVFVIFEQLLVKNIHIKKTCWDLKSYCKPLILMITTTKTCKIQKNALAMEDPDSKVHLKGHDWCCQGVERAGANTKYSTLLLHQQNLRYHACTNHCTASLNCTYVNRHQVRLCPPRSS